jgi:signal transduction histidine kinase/CheY-like chemotaxis protein
VELRPPSAGELHLPSLLTPLDDRSHDQHVRALRVFAGLILALATLALLGQATGWIWLAGGRDPRRNIVPMAPSTAFTFLVLGGALLAASWPRYQRAAVLPAALVGLWGAIKLSEWLTSIALDVKFSLEAWLIQGTQLNLMSPITGGSFLLCSISLLLVLRRPSPIAGALVGLVMAANGLVLMGHLYDAPAIYGGNQMLVAYPTALCFLCFAVGHACLSGPESFPLSLVVGHSTQAMLLRSFLPLTVGTIIIEGILRCRLFVYLDNPVYTAAVSVVVSAAVVALLVWRISGSIGRKLDAAEEARQRALNTLRLAKESAEQANLSKSLFLANMSHELRTPLGHIIGYTEILQEDTTDNGDETYLPDLHRIHTSGKHLLTLINDILDLSKIEAGKIELFLETFDLDVFVDEIGEMVQPLAARKNNRLVVEKCAPLGKVHNDVTRVRQCLFNLLSNACKFTEKGTITLRVERNGNTLTMSVKDTGIGMTQEQLSKLFQPFTQADNSTTRRYGGTGLGLTICLKLCEMLGGAISVESEPGTGSTFTMRLSADVQARPAPVLPRDVSQPRQPEHALGTVLIIDDDAAVREVLTRFLTREGFRTLSASSGAEGVRLAREKRPDAITLDVMMPEMDGWSVLLALKADHQLADIPVIMLTIVDDRNLGYTLGAVEYLTKPVDRQRLLSALKKYCPASGRHVLIVEDEAATRDLLRRTLESDGWQVDEADNGVTGLEQVRKRCPDLILLDLMMPEMDGFEFVRQLRQNEEWRSIPVLVVTAKSITGEDRAQLNGHVSQVLQKGAYTREDLLREVSRTLSRQMAHLNGQRSR